MPLSIRNAKTVALAREVAAMKGLGVTETIHKALESERAELASKQIAPVDLAEVTRRIVEEFKKDGRTGLKADKAFFDSLYDE
jgi:antitoxin VapB